MDLDRIEGCETARYSGVATAKRYQRVVDTEFAQMTRHNTGPVTGCRGSEPIIVRIKASTSSVAIVESRCKHNRLRLRSLSQHGCTDANFDSST